MNEPPSLLRNDLAGKAHWLKIFLVGSKSNRSAIGSRVTVRYGGRRQAQEVMAQASFFSVNDRRLHFGLGSAAEADVEIRWASGALVTHRALAADKLYAIHERDGVSVKDFTR